MWKLDTRKPDNWNAILRPYEKLTLDVVWKRGDEGTTSKVAFDYCNDNLPDGKTISRASVIFFLDKAVDVNIVTWRDATGKGGHHRIYVPNMTWSELEDHIVLVFMRKLGLIFPENETLDKFPMPRYVEHLPGVKTA